MEGIIQSPYGINGFDSMDAMDDPLALGDGLFEEDDDGPVIALPIFQDLLVGTPGDPINGRTPLPIGTSWATAAYSETVGSVIHPSGKGVDFTPTSIPRDALKALPSPSGPDVLVTANIRHDVAAGEGSTTVNALVAIGIRMADQATFHGYEALIFINHVHLFQWINGSDTHIGDYDITGWTESTESMKFEFQAIGDNLIIRIDDVERVNVTNSVHTGAGEVSLSGRQWNSPGNFITEDFTVLEL